MKCIHCLLSVFIWSFFYAQVIMASTNNVYAGCTQNNALDVCTINGVCSPQGECVCYFGWGTLDQTINPYCNYRFCMQSDVVAQHLSIQGYFGAADQLLGFTGWAMVKL